MTTVRRLSGFNAFEDAARGASPEVSGAREPIPLVPESFAPAVQISRLFPFWSYHSTTLGVDAIRPQPPNDPIVSVTEKEDQISGYAVGLHPSSETPIAIEFRTGGQQGSSAVHILKPGEILRPHGLPRGQAAGSFSGIRWGLPFGWLGGGLVTLVVFRTPDSDVLWHGNKEVVFHRLTLPVIQPAAVPASLGYNWPTRFPWPLAINDAVNAQGGSAVLHVEPTRLVMALRPPSDVPLVAPISMRILYQATDEFGFNAYDVATAQVQFVDEVWGSWSEAGMAGAAIAARPMMEMPSLDGRIGANAGGITLVDLSGTAALSGAYVDIVRYGRL